MKPLSILVLSFLLSLACAAQKNATPIAVVKLPLDSITNLVAYEMVVPVQGATSDMLYKRALEWFHAYYKNPTEVIRESDVEKGKILGKPRFKIYNPADKEGLKTDAGAMQYTITIAVKQGRYKYELTAFNWKQPSYYAIERWMDTKAPGYTPVYNHYLTQTDEYVKDLLRNLKAAMASDKTAKDKDNW